MRQHAASAQGAFVPLVYVNACGMQNNGKNVMVFDGDSTIYDEQGERQLSLNDQLDVYKRQRKDNAKLPLFSIVSPLGSG